MTLSTVTFQTKTWLIKPHFATGAIKKEDRFLLVYASKHIAMKTILNLSELLNSTGIRLGENKNVLLLLMRI